MLARSLSLLAAGTMLVLLAAFAASSVSAIGGAAVGVVSSASAVLGAHLADRWQLGIRPSLMIVVLGMLARIAFVSIATILALRLYDADALPFAAGLASVVVLGQALEIWMLTRLRRAGG